MKFFIQFKDKSFCGFALNSHRPTELEKTNSKENAMGFPSHGAAFQFGKWMIPVSAGQWEIVN
jgi:hypothetical protein